METKPHSHLKNPEIDITNIYFFTKLVKLHLFQ